jgi:putative peptidoglycan lipid II flippase
MFLKAGAVSLALLLLSRVLGLVRESALAADVAVLMLTLPDWIAGVLASGALAYVLLPHWAQSTPAQQAAVQRRVAWALMAGGVVLALGLVLPLWMGHGALLRLLLPSDPVRSGAFSAGAQALVWAGCGLPAALLAALWVTRLQHERDVVGMYGANVVVNACLVLAVSAIGVWGGADLAVTQLGFALSVALGLRLLWLRWRLGPVAREVGSCTPVQAPHSHPNPPLAMPSTSLWLWAALSAGLPLALPFVARSAASGAGEGALATFNYAWKLVELPLMLAIQLVATLAFPAITRAMAATGAEPNGDPNVRSVIRRALALAWVLACAAVAALSVGATAVADLLFGWGRMDATSLAQVADWGRIGAWGLLPQAITAVAVTVLAAQGRMRGVALVYAAALAAATVALFMLTRDVARATNALNAVPALAGRDLMVGLNVLSAGVALALLAMLRGTGWVPWRAIAVAGLSLGLVQAVLIALNSTLPQQKGLLPLVLSGFVAIVIASLSMATVPEVRHSLRR